MALSITSINKKKAPKRLDPTRPYNQCFSVKIGKFYEQDGLTFYINGKQIGAKDDEPVRECPDDPQYARLRSTTVNTGPVNYWNMHWKELKGLVESFGGVYRSKEDAIQYLEGIGM